MFFLIPLLVLVVGVELVFFRFWSYYWSKYQYFFFSLQAFLSEVLLLLAGMELDKFGAKVGRGFLTGLLQEFQIEETFDLPTMKWASQLSHGQRGSLSYRINDGCRLACTSASIAFLTSFSQLSCSRPRYFIWVFINGLRSLRKNWIRSNSSEAPFSSNFGEWIRGV